MSSIGEKIRDRRKWRNLTQQQLADAAGMSVMSIRRYESGEREPTERTVETIAQVLNVHPSELDERFGFFLGSDVIVKAEDGEFIRASMATREGKLLSSFQALNDQGKDEVIKYADVLLDSNRYRRHPLDEPDIEPEKVKRTLDRIMHLMGSGAAEPPEEE